jgi:peptide/nickel transport system substrate-binding protein
VDVYPTRRDAARVTTDGRSRLTRRAALRLLASSSGVMLLAACAPSAPQQQTGQQAAPAKPTEAAKPAAPAATTAPAAAAKPTEAAKPAAPAATAPPTMAATTASAAKPTGQPKNGGSLRVGQVGDIPRIDGHLTTGSDTTWIPFDRLTAYDERMQPQPMLAESWEQNKDLSQIKLNLRKGVQFHTGRELTSEDIKWNVIWVRQPPIASGALIVQSKWWTEIETPDKHTVILKSDQPRPATFDFFEYFNIIDRETAEGPEATTKMVGTGPFQLVEWIQGDRLRFVKHKNYWNSGKPYLDEILVTVHRDPQAMATQLEAGTLDVAVAPPVGDFARLIADPKYKGVTVPSTTFVIGTNTTMEPTNNKLLRQTINYAIDRQRITDVVFHKTVTPTSIPWIPSSDGYDAEKAKTYTLNIDKAKEAFAKSGLSNVELDVTTSTAVNDQLGVAQILQFELAKLGIKLNIKTYEPGTYINQINNRRYQGIYVGNTAYASMQPITCIANSRHLDSTGNSNSGFTSDKYRELHAAASVEPDLAKRKQLYGQITDLILDESFTMPIASVPNRMVTRAAVQNVQGSRHGSILYNEAWIE